ncbi:MAG: EamA family transporter, partial [bacterium]|nr:EamA family transporter [bacterium]
ITILILGVNGFSLVALQMLPAVSVIVVTATIPVFVALFNKKLGREHLGARFWCGAFLCLAGVFIAVDIFPAIAAGKFASGSVLGYLAVAGAAACAVIYRVNMEALTKDFDPRLLLMWAFGINALLVLIFVCPFMGAIPGEALPMAFVIGLSAAVANTAMLLSIRAVGSTFISFIALLQKPLVIVAASFFLSEHLSLMQWLGVVLLLIGLKLARPKRMNQ